MEALSPKKSLGQHFLTDKNIARKIVSSVSDTTGNLIEIGPGKGILSKLLIERFGRKVIFVDTDHRMIEHLKQQFPQNTDQFIHSDILKTDIKQFVTGNFSLVGNLPYNISAPVFFRILELRNDIDEVVCMIQKEVAHRINAGPGSKEYGILSVLVKAWFHCELLFDVGPTVFSPPPKVQSTVMRLKRKEAGDPDCDPKVFVRVVKSTFGKRRKMIRNSLRSSGYSIEALSGHILSMRPEQMTIQDFADIAKLIKSTSE